MLLTRRSNAHYTAVELTSETSLLRVISAKEHSGTGTILPLPQAPRTQTLPVT
ncbi:hypothetical protein OLMES_4668 [Oleiphilus messinensis]|uniref:Uncharacterized protein n=1 Tax=Oleiphilus messinensis TaxID=141451 RepID=A0A1Y0IGZ0_9GAMM|nr:hypothetical protein OLMES_4668 [Oleiphilus messinensis]